MPTTQEPERGKSKRFYRMRENLVDVAAGLFAKNGYASTGVAEIGDATGLARGALYYYMGSKEELLAVIHDRVMDPLLTEAEVIVGLEVSFPARLRLLSESLLRQIINRHDHVWVFLHEYRQLQGEDRDRFREKRNRFEEYVRGVLAEGQREGHVRVKDLGLTTLAFLNLHNYTYQWVAGHEALGVVELSRFYCEIFLNGIATAPVDQAAAEPELERGRAALRDAVETATRAANARAARPLFVLNGLKI